jgi:transposase
VRGLGNPVTFHLTAGHRGDVPQAGPLIAGLAAQIVMADGAYDAAHFRALIAQRGAVPVIPNTPQRACKFPFDRHIYRERHLVECCFSRLKQFRRVATRYEKTAQNYLAVVTLAATVLWLR